MNYLVAFLSVVIAVQGRPSEVATPLIQIPVSEVISQYHAQDSAGQYSYSYTSPLSSRAEFRTLDGITNGAYNYVDPDGKVQTVEYTADANGFQLKSATNLPQAPAVPEYPKLEAPTPVSDTPEVVEARNRHLEALKQAELLGSQQPAKIEETIVKTPFIPPVQLFRLTPTFQAFPISAPFISLNYDIPGASITYATYQAPFLPGYGFQIAGAGLGSGEQTVQGVNPTKEDDDTVTIEAKFAPAEEEKKDETESIEEKKEEEKEEVEKKE